MTEKTCQKCKLTKILDEFHLKRARGREYRSGTCKVCHRCDTRRHYSENKETALANYNQRRKSMVSHFRALKANPCADCGSTFPPYVMDFDHRPGEKKLFKIGSSYYKRAYDQVIAEIAKCDLVCANCHRIRTYNRRENNE